MKFGLLVILIALLVVITLVLGKGPQTHRVSQAAASLDKAKGATLEPIMRLVAAAIDLYADENKGCPEDLEELVPRYLSKNDLLIDPWGTRLRLERGDPLKIALVSAGPDRRFATGDDSRRSL